MAVPWNVSNADVQRDLHRGRHLLYRHHLRPQRQGDQLGDQLGPEALHHHPHRAEHHGHAGGPEVQLVVMRGVVPVQGGQPLQQGEVLSMCDYV